MEFLFWFGIFAVLAILATLPVHFHLAAMRKASNGGSQVSLAKETKTKPCPRCQKPSPVDAAFCESCGVPMMLWSLKTAPEAREMGESESRQVPIIDQDLCIGCSSCVDACERNVLEIIAGKSTVIDLNSCTSPGLCAEVCPTGACQIGGHGGSRKLEVPQINSNFETNQQGIYAIGELGGLGLIKNAVTEGKLVIEKILGSHQPTDGVLDLIIVGAGPAGLSAGLAAKESGLKAMVFEQQTLANTIRRFPNRKIVMAEPVQMPLYGSLWISDAPKETLLNVWETIVQSAGLDIRENEMVTNVTRFPHGTFLVQTGKGSYESLKVVLAIGKRGTPRKLEAQGSELPKVLYQLTDAVDYTDSKVLVVGGGDSAAESAIGLSKQVGTTVTLSYRKQEFSRLKDKNRTELESYVQAGKVNLLLGSEVLEVGEQEVLINCGNGEPRRLENDYVFACLGGTSARGFLENIGIPMVTKEVMLETSIA